MYLVAGLGVTGQSVLRYFQFQGEPCLAFDTRATLDCEPLKAQFSEVEFACGDLPTDWISRFDTVVLSPGISLQTPWVQTLLAMGKQVIGDIELFARAVSVPVIGITGSNGKSTVTTMVGQVLQQAGLRPGVGGNIGQPALDLLIDDHDYDVMVLELSSFQLETTNSLQTLTSTVLNISEDHMDRYASLGAYIQAKTRLLDQTSCAVLPNDFDLFGVSQPEKVVRFGLVEADILPDDQYGILREGEQRFLGVGQQKQVPIAQLPDQTQHFLLNALATMALTAPFTISAETYTHVFSQFQGLPYRTSVVGEFEKVLWINDSKGTNVGATLAALQSYLPQAKAREGHLYLIAGGEGKEADFSPLKSTVRACQHVVLFGKDAQKIAEALALEAQVSLVDTLADAVQLIYTKVKEKDIVLFSPACASFDQFANYSERGRVFDALVQARYAPSPQIIESDLC